VWRVGTAEDPADLLDEQDAAEVLGVEYSTVRKDRSAGRLPGWVEVCGVAHIARSRRGVGGGRPRRLEDGRESQGRPILSLSLRAPTAVRIRLSRGKRIQGFDWRHGRRRAGTSSSEAEELPDPRFQSGWVRRGEVLCRHFGSLAISLDESAGSAGIHD
jgi:hypothetical protein